MRSLRRLSTMASQSLRALERYNGCDVSDALLKLKVPKAGFISDLLPYAPHGPYSPSLATQSKTIAPASTVLFVPKTHTTNAPSSTNSSSDNSNAPQIPKESNIPTGKHHVDLTEPSTIVVISQPPDQTCAVLGGIMAQRTKMREALGVVVSGRIRDLRELRELDFPVYARGSSAVATSAEAKPWAIGVPVDVGGLTVHPGDIVFADPIDGVVVIPKDKLDEVLELLPKITGEDEKVIEDVRAGSTVREAFDKHRGTS